MLEVLGCTLLVLRNFGSLNAQKPLRFNGSLALSHTGFSSVGAVLSGWECESEQITE